jgi:hypothetical protein
MHLTSLITVAATLVLATTGAQATGCSIEGKGGGYYRYTVEDIGPDHNLRNCVVTRVSLYPFP